MRISIVNKNSVLSDSLESRIEKKLGKLDKFFEEDQPATVRLAQERGGRNIVEITIVLEGTVLRAEDVSSDMYVSLDGAVDKLVRQIRRHRTKLEKRLREGAYQEETPEFIEDISAYGTGERQIVRTKEFPVRPMAVEDAILQMELLGHSFFVFVNIETERTNVLYLRKDGNLGLMVPEA